VLYVETEAGRASELAATSLQAGPMAELERQLAAAQQDLSMANDAAAIARSAADTAAARFDDALVKCKVE